MSADEIEMRNEMEAEIADGRIFDEGELETVVNEAEKKSDIELRMESVEEEETKEQIEYK